MSNDDVVRAEDLAAIRAIVGRARRRVMIAAVLTPIVAGLTVALIIYYLKAPSLAVSGLILGIFVLLGVPVLIHWRRHYRIIFKQLDALEHRVSGGEIVYGSEVEFHSYR